MYLLPFIFNLFIAIMSSVGSNGFERNLYGEQAADDLRRHQKSIFVSDVGALMASIVAFTSSDVSPLNAHKGRSPGSKNIKRKRLNVDEHFLSMDPALFRRKYRMGFDSFYKLLDILEPHLKDTGEDMKFGSTPNGPITKSARLSMALRYFAGGDPADICDHHGCSLDEPLRSVWFVVDAIHEAPEMNIVFPQTHEEQALVAEGFRAKSEIGIDNCVGAIDGILIWIHKPGKNDVKAIKFEPAKFYCGRKKKFGLNMQAMCDARGRFLDVEIKYPGSTSDFFAFEQSELKSDIERKGFLRPGLCLFGDNAYVNAPYMCVPFRNLVMIPDNLEYIAKDGFNFFQSQVRINIECAFGILVHRFGILRKPIPVNISVQKTTSLVLALCKLHNFCINQNDSNVSSAFESDVANIVREGGIYRPSMDKDGNATWSYDFQESSKDRLSSILDGGDHHDDHSREDRRKYRYRKHLPRDAILRKVRNGGHGRPPRSRSRR